MGIGPEVDDLTGELGAIVGEQGRWRAAQIDQPIEHAGNVPAAKPRADLDRQRFPREHVDHRQQPDFRAARELIVDEVQAPRLVWPGCLTPRLPVRRHLPSSWPSPPENKAFLAIEPVDHMLADLPALSFQHDMHAPIAVTDSRRQEMVFDAHDKAFAFFGGACARGIYDNMKTAVDTILVGKDRAYNRRFQQMCGHYLVEPVACTPASGWEKGQVENQVGVIRRRFFVPRPRFKSYAELNAWLLDRCVAWAKAHPHPDLRDKTIWEVLESERPSLVPYVGPFDGFHAVPASVSKTCLVRFDTNRYSVDARAVGRPVEIRAYAERVEFWQDGKVVGEHPRAFGRGKAIYDPLHYIPVLARKPGALRNGAPFKEWELPSAMRRVRRKLAGVPDGDRQMVDILGAVLSDGLDAVEDACAEALSEGVHSAAVILNILARRREPPPPLTIATPEALRLTCEPVADCTRYDSLRRPDHGKIAGAGRNGPAQALRNEGGL